MADPNLGVIASTTLRNYRTELVDNIFKSSALWYLLKDKVRIEDGGENIVVPLMYGKNTTAGSYADYDLLDTTPQTGIDAAQFNWKQLSVSISISGAEERKNNGRSRVINLLEGKIKQAEMSIVETANQQSWSDGTGNAGKDLTGLTAMLISTGTYGGISRSTYSFWAAKDSGSTAIMTIDLIRSRYNDCSKGGSDTPDLLVSTQALFEMYEGLLQTKQTYEMVKNRPEKVLGDAGFEVIKFKGSGWTWDEQATTASGTNGGYVNYINSRHVTLVAHTDANFETTDFVKPENQDAKVAQVLFMGNLTCDACLRVGRRLFTTA